MSKDLIDPAATADNVIDFTPEKHKRALAEAERLARQGPIEYPLWIDDSAKRLDIPVATRQFRLQPAVEVTLYRVETLVAEVVLDQDDVAVDAVAAGR